MYNHKSKPGFTIIEVVLVLAIAGLIFLMVFIALPALQRNQRDTQRKNDMGNLITAIQRYQSNNRGKIPQTSSEWQGSFTSDYLRVGGDEFRDPDGSRYILAWTFISGGVEGNAVVGTLPTVRKVHESSPSAVIWIYLSAKCNGSITEPVVGSSKVAFSIVLEGGGVYCVNN